MTHVPNLISCSAATSSPFSSLGPKNNEFKGTFLHDCLDIFLPIICRGRFFEDPFFENIRVYFEDEFRTFIDDWNILDTKTDAWFERVIALNKRLNDERKIDICTEKPNNQALSISLNSGDCKIIVNVGELKADEIKLRVSGNRIAVQGRKISNKHHPSRNFHYQFVMPKNPFVSTITSVLSSDGLLTVTVPKMTKTIGTSSGNVKLTNSPVMSEKSKETTSGMLFGVYENRCQNPLFHSTQDENVSYIDNPLNRIIQNQQNSGNLNNKIEKITKFETKTDGSRSKNITIKSKGRPTEEVYCNADNQRKFKKKPIRNETHLQTYPSSENVLSSCPSSYFRIPVRIMGSSTNSFHYMKNNFPALFDGFLAKRQIRSVTKINSAHSPINNISEVVKAEDQLHYMYAIDVQDFLPDGEIIVSCIDGRELSVDCQWSGREIPSKLKNTFTVKCFLPEDSQPQSAQAMVISSEGLAIIIVSKKNKKTLANEHIVPITFDIARCEEKWEEKPIKQMVEGNHCRQHSPVTSKSVADDTTITFQCKSLSPEKRVSAQSSNQVVSKCEMPVQMSELACTTRIENKMDEKSGNDHLKKIINEIEVIEPTKQDNKMLNGKESKIQVEVSDTTSQEKKNTCDGKEKRTELSSGDWQTSSESSSEKSQCSDSDDEEMAVFHLNNTNLTLSPEDESDKKNSPLLSPDTWIKPENKTPLIFRNLSTDNCMSKDRLSYSLDRSQTTSSSDDASRPSFSVKLTDSSKTTATNEENEYGTLKKVRSNVLIHKNSSKSPRSASAKMHDTIIEEPFVEQQQESETLRSEEDKVTNAEMMHKLSMEDEEICIRKSPGTEAAYDIASIVNSVTDISNDVYDVEEEEHDDDDESSCASTVIDLPSYSRGYGESSVLETPYSNYRVTLAESPSDLQTSFQDWGDSQRKLTQSSCFGNSERQYLQPFSTLSIHTLDDSDINCDESCNSSVYELSAYSSIDDYPSLNDDTLSLLNRKDSVKHLYGGVLQEQTHAGQNQSDQLQNTKSRDIQDTVGLSLKLPSDNSKRQNAAIEEWIANNASARVSADISNEATSEEQNRWEK